MQHHRFHLLDALRGVAAVLVSIVHEPILAQRLHLQGSFVAVDFFFCLSGFVIAFSYERRLASTYRTRTFLVARLIRLYPTYLFATVLGMLFALQIGLFVDGAALSRATFLKTAALSLFLLPNLSHRLHPFLFPLDFPAWSLFYEIIVNLGYAVAVRRLGTKSFLLWLTWIFAAATLVFGFLHGHRLDQYGWPSDYSLVPFALARVLLSFSSGVLLLRLYRSRTSWLLPPPAQFGLGLLSAGGFFFLLFAPAHFAQTEIFRLGEVALLIPAVIFCGALTHVYGSWSALCSFLGDLSYPFYLLNIGYVRSLQLAMTHLRTAFRPAHSLFLGPVSLIFVAYGFARLLDAPLRRHISARFNARPRERGAAA